MASGGRRVVAAVAVAAAAIAAMAAAVAGVATSASAATAATAAAAGGGSSLAGRADRQALVKLLAALSAANTRLTRPDAYGTSDGAGGRGGMRGRTNATAGRPALVVSLHGLGSSGAHAVEGLVDDLPESTAAYTSIIGPSAGTDRAGNERSWFPIGAISVGTVPTADVAAGAAADLAAAADRIDAVIAAAASRGGVPRSRVVVAGFSQGAAAAIDYVAAGRAAGVAGVVVWGGWLPRPAAPAAAAAAAGVRVAVLHGRYDWLVPPAAAARAAAALRRAGARVSVRHYAAGHFLGNHGPAEAAIAAFVRAAVPP